jgi:type II secretory ATPase GspE/PulE/Tfp pilus assembly ATPase PilB-like protein
MSQIKQAAQARGFVPLRRVALAVACAGETSLEELDRVTLAE